MYLTDWLSSKKGKKVWERLTWHWNIFYLLFICLDKLHKDCQYSLSFSMIHILRHLFINKQQFERREERRRSKSNTNEKHIVHPPNIIFKLWPSKQAFLSLCSCECISMKTHTLSFIPLKVTKRFLHKCWFQSKRVICIILLCPHDQLYGQWTIVVHLALKGKTFFSSHQWHIL